MYCKYEIRDQNGKLLDTRAEYGNRALATIGMKAGLRRLKKADPKFIKSKARVSVTWYSPDYHR